MRPKAMMQTIATMTKFLLKGQDIGIALPLVLATLHGGPADEHPGFAFRRIPFCGTGFGQQHRQDPKPETLSSADVLLLVVIHLVDTMHALACGVF